MVEITDRRSARTWAAQQSAKSVAGVAARGALRLAGSLQIGDDPEGTKGDLLAMRALILSCSSAVSECEDLRLAVDSLNSRIEKELDQARITHVSFDVALGAVYAANSDMPSFLEASGDYLETWADAYNKIGLSALERDAEQVTKNKQIYQLFSAPLWPLKIPDDLSWVSTWEWEFPGQREQSKAWGFWRNWYAGMVAGEPMDWALQEAVALIPNEIWDAGPEAVAEEIERIQAEFLAKKLPLAEEIRVNPETHRFYAEPIPPAKPRLLAASLADIEDKLEDALAVPSNGLQEDTRLVRDLRRVFRRYANDPQQVEIKLTSVHASLLRQITDDWLPASDENLALAGAVDQGATWIRENDPDIAENRRQIVDVAFRDMSEDDRARFETAPEVLAAISEGDLAEDWLDDIPEALDYPGRPSPYSHTPEGWESVLSRDAKWRVFNRLGKIVLLLKATPGLIHRVHDGAAHKMVALGLSASALWAFLKTLVAIGSKLVH